MMTLGQVGNFYVLVLLMILVIGFAYLGRKLLNENKWFTSNTIFRTPPKGDLLLSNKWLRMAFAAFLGIIIAGFVQGLLAIGGVMGVMGIPR